MSIDMYARVNFLDRLYLFLRIFVIMNVEGYYLSTVTPIYATVMCVIHSSSKNAFGMPQNGEVVGKTSLKEILTLRTDRLEHEFEFD